MSRKFYELATVLVLVCVLSVSAFVNVKAQEAPRTGGTLRIAGKYSPWVFIGQVLQGYRSCSDMGNNINQHLLTIGPGYEWKPLLAQSWEASSDGKNWTFHLVTNATWSDGVPFTAADVWFTYRLVCNMTANDNPPTILPDALPYSAYLPQHLVSVNILDAYTVEMCFDQLTLLSQVVYPMYSDNCIIPKHIFEGTDLLANLAIYKPIGTGPFLLADWVKDNYYILERNENYWGTKAYLDKVIFYIVASAQAAALKLEAGEVDLVDQQRWIPLSEIATFKANPSFEVDGWPYYTLIRIPFNFNTTVTANNPWILDARVRQALDYAIDKQAIVETVLYNATVVNPGPIPVSTGWLQQPSQTYEYNTTLANQLLDEAGWPVKQDGWRFDAGTMICYSSWVNIAQVVAEMWKAVKVNVAVSAVDDTSFSGKYETIANGGLGDTVTCALNNEGFGPDPSIISQVIQTNANRNLGFFSDALIDEYLTKGQSTVNDTERVYWYGKFADRYQELVPAIHIAAKFLVSAWSVDFNNIESLRPQKWALAYNLIWWAKGTPIPTEPTTPENISEVAKRLADLESAFAAQTSEYQNLTSQINGLQDQLTSANSMTYAALGVAAVSIVVAAIAVISSRRKRP